MIRKTSLHGGALPVLLIYAGLISFLLLHLLEAQVMQTKMIAYAQARTELLVWAKKVREKISVTLADHIPNCRVSWHDEDFFRKASLAWWQRHACLIQDKTYQGWYVLMPLVKSNVYAQIDVRVNTKGLPQTLLWQMNVMTRPQRDVRELAARLVE